MCGSNSFCCFFFRPSSGLWQDLLIKMRLWKFSCLTTTNTCPTGRQALIEAVSEGDGWGQEGAHTSTCNGPKKTLLCPLAGNFGLVFECYILSLYGDFVHTYSVYNDTSETAVFWFECEQCL